MFRSASAKRIAVSLATPAILLTLSLGWLPNAQTLPQSGDSQVQRIIASLEPDNTLRIALERGDRGDGTLRGWMGEMRQQGVKQATYRVRFLWSPTSKKLAIEDRTYLTQYYRFDSKVSDAVRLKRILQSGLAKHLEKEILVRARHNVNQRAHDMASSWVCGTLYLNLLDDAVLPILDEPAQIDGTDKDKCSHYQ